MSSSSAPALSPAASSAPRRADRPQASPASPYTTCRLAAQAPCRPPCPTRPSPSARSAASFRSLGRHRRLAFLHALRRRVGGVRLGRPSASAALRPSRRCGRLGDLRRGLAGVDGLQRLLLEALAPGADHRAVEEGGIGQRLDVPSGSDERRPICEPAFTGRPAARSSRSFSKFSASGPRSSRR